MPEEKGIFAKASNFDELYSMLKEEEVVVGSGEQEYEAESLITKIDEFRAGLEKILLWTIENACLEDVCAAAVENIIQKDAETTEKIRRVTRAGGLRFKVSELAVKEAVEKANAGKETNRVNRDILASHDTVAEAEQPGNSP